MLISNVRHSFGSMSIGRVRSVSMLGSTSTATICNIGNTGNIVLLAAGHKLRRGPRVSFATGFNFGRPSTTPR